MTMQMTVIASGSKANCYVLDDGKESVLLDFGCTSKEIIRGTNYRLQNVKGALLSHFHSDHSRSVRWMLDNRIPVYTCPETLQSLPIDSNDPAYGIVERSRFCVGSFRVRPFYVPHDGTPCYAFFIEHKQMGRMIYATDFMTIPFSLKNLHINHWLIECNYSDQLMRDFLDIKEDGDNTEYDHTLHSCIGHCSLEKTKDIIAKNRTDALKTITLCHLSEAFSDPQKMISEVQEVVGKDVLVQVARPKLKVDLTI